MAEQAVAVNEETNVSTPEEKKKERFVAPPVDIFETAEGLVVVADVPGVAQDDLDVRVDRDVLTIRGHASYVAPGGNGGWEYGVPSVFRQFKLGEAIDADHIAAELTHGVLRLHLPKAEAAKARKVEVKVS